MAPRVGLAALAGLPLAAVGAALYTQHRLDMMPCAWCVLQRLIFLAVSAAAMAALLLPAGRPRQAAAGLAGVLALSGVAAALWQHFVAGESASCAMSLADRILGATGLDSRFPDLFMAYASCAEAKVDLAGLPYEFWSLGVFLLLAALAARLAVRSDRQP